MRTILMLIAAAVFALGSLACNDLDSLDTEPGTFNHGGANTLGGATAGGHSASLSDYLEDPDNAGEIFTSDIQGQVGASQSYTQPIDPDDDRAVSDIDVGS